jgi:hypothetical protein
MRVYRLTFWRWEQAPWTDWRVMYRHDWGSRRIMVRVHGKWIYELAWLDADQSCITRPLVEL